VVRVTILALGCLYVAQAVRERRLVWPRLGLAVFIVPFLGLAIVSVWRSPYVQPAQQWTIVLFSYAALLYLIAFFLRTWDDVVRVLAPIVLVAGAEALMAIIQRIGLHAERPAGTFFNPNFLAGMAAVASMLTISLVSIRSRQTARLRGPLLWTGLAILAGGVLCSGSRGAFVAWIVGGTVVLLLSRGWRAVAIPIVVLAAVLVAPNPLWNRMEQEHRVNPLSYARLNIWESSLAAIQAHPFGAGLGLYQYVYPRYALPVDGGIARYAETAQTAHSEYLQMAVELSPAAVLLFIGGAVIVLRAAARGLRQAREPWHRGLLIGAIGGFVVILVHAAVDSVLHEPPIAIAFVICVAVMLAAEHLGTSERPVRMWQLSSHGAALALGLSVVLLGTALTLRDAAGWLFYEKAGGMLRDGDVERAIGDYQMATLIEPGKALYHAALSSAYAQRYGKRDDPLDATRAIAELQTAETLNPLSGALAAQQGRLYERLGAVKETSAQRSTLLQAAYDAYDRAAGREPFNAFHQWERAKVLAALGERVRAEEAMRRAVALEPNFLVARGWLVQQYVADGRYGQAKTEYTEVVNRRQTYAAWPKHPYEAALLRVDLEALRTIVERAGT
jgi:tetratricopeptide (TPR) repeat protein